MNDRELAEKAYPQPHQHSDLPSQLYLDGEFPGLRWTTDAQLRLDSDGCFRDPTATEQPVVARGRDASELLSPCPAAFMSAHEAALSGQVTRVQFVYGSRRYVGVIQPRSSPENRSAGVSGFALAQPDAPSHLAVLGRVAGHMAHDLNNIVTIILSYAQFILDDLDKSHPLREDANVVIDAARRISALVAQLWSFSGRQTLRPCRVDLGALVRDRAEALDLHGAEGITLALTSVDGPLWVQADPSLLAQAIDAVLSNALEAMDGGGGALRVQLGERSTAAERLASLVICDEGCGMSQATRQRLFEPFFTTKPRKSGQSRGLGLASAYGIVRQCGGSIEVSSEVGRGTCCQMELPIIGHHPPDSATLTPG